MQGRTFELHELWLHQSVLYKPVCCAMSTLGFHKAPGTVYGSIYSLIGEMK